jgi:hypothetical protein
MSRFARLAATLAAAVSLAGCCADGKCIKDPPCRPCENPCCLTPVQKKALGASTHALVGPRVYSYDEKTYILFTEKGLKDFEKDPSAFEEKGAVRLVRGKTWRVDMNPGEGVDLDALGARPVPYTPPPKPAK